MAYPKSWLLGLLVVVLSLSDAVAVTCSGGEQAACRACSVERDEAGCEANGLWTPCLDGQDAMCEQVKLTDKRGTVYSFSRICKSATECQPSCTESTDGEKTCIKCIDAVCRPPGADCDDGKQPACLTCTAATTDVTCDVTGGWATCRAVNAVCKTAEAADKRGTPLYFSRSCSETDLCVPGCTNDATTSGRTCVTCQSTPRCVDRTTCGQCLVCNASNEVECQDQGHLVNCPQDQAVCKVSTLTDARGTVLAYNSDCSTRLLCDLDEGEYQCEDSAAGMECHSCRSPWSCETYNANNVLQCGTIYGCHICSGVASAEECRQPSNYQLCDTGLCEVTIVKDTQGEVENYSSRCLPSGTFCKGAPGDPAYCGAPGDDGKTTCSGCVYHDCASPAAGTDTTGNGGGNYNNGNNNGGSGNEVVTIPDASRCTRWTAGAGITAVAMGIVASLLSRI